MRNVGSSQSAADTSPQYVNLSCACWAHGKFPLPMATEPHMQQLKSGQCREAHTTQPSSERRVFCLFHCRPFEKCTGLMIRARQMTKELCVCVNTGLRRANFMVSWSQASQSRPSWQLQEPMPPNNTHTHQQTQLLLQSVFLLFSSRCPSSPPSVYSLSGGSFCLAPTSLPPQYFFSLHRMASSPSSFCSSLFPAECTTTKWPVYYQVYQLLREISVSLAAKCSSMFPA